MLKGVTHAHLGPIWYHWFWTGPLFYMSTKNSDRRNFPIRILSVSQTASELFNHFIRNPITETNVVFNVKLYNKTFSVFKGSFSAWKDGRCHFKGFGRGGRAEMFTRYKRLQRFPTTQVNNRVTSLELLSLAGE